MLVCTDLEVVPKAQELDVILDLLHLKLVHLNLEDLVYRILNAENLEVLPEVLRVDLSYREHI